MDCQVAYFEFLCRLGDNALVLGHRISEWCGHGPTLEEDIALANTALDLIGEATVWLELAAKVENKHRTANDLAMLRDAWEFRNVLMVEQPNGDFGQTIMRQYLYDAWHVPMLTALAESNEMPVAAAAAKIQKEAQYHLLRSRNTVIGLGDGTLESHQRMQAALDWFYPYVGELFERDEIDDTVEQKGVVKQPTSLWDHYYEEISATLQQATLQIPAAPHSHSGGKNGRQHSEHLGHILTQLQWLQRAYPGAEW